MQKVQLNSRKPVFRNCKMILRILLHNHGDAHRGGCVSEDSGPGTTELSHQTRDNRGLGNKPVQELVCKQHEEHIVLPYTARRLSGIVEPE